MKSFFYTLRLHFLFIVLTQILYSLIYLFRPEVLDSWWEFLYSGICLFIYLAAGWIIMHELGKRWWTLLAGPAVFIAGYVVNGLTIFIIGPLTHHLPISAATVALPKFLQFSVYYILIALALSFVGGHLCRQKQRFKVKNHLEEK
jgi:hypothetical protein